MVLQTLFLRPSDLAQPSESFNTVADKIIVSPILTTFIFSRVPASTKAFVRRIATWDFVKVVPCHFEAPFDARPGDVAAAFEFLGWQPGELP